MWQDLNIQQKSELIKDYVRNGITSLSDMQAMYDHQSQQQAPVSTFINGQPKWRPRVLGGEGRPRPKQMTLDDAVALATDMAYEQIRQERERGYTLGGNLFEGGGDTERDKLWQQVYNSRGSANLPYEQAKDYDVKYYPDGSIMPMTYEEWVEPIKKSGQYSDRDGTVTNKYGQKQTLGEQYDLYRRQVEQDNSDYLKLKYPGDINDRRVSMGLEKIGHGKYANGLFTAFGAPLAGAMMLPAASMLAGAGVGSAIGSSVSKAIPWVAKNVAYPMLKMGVVDEGLKLTTGKGFGENVTEHIIYPLSKEWADITGNPNLVIKPTQEAAEVVNLVHPGLIGGNTYVKGVDYLLNRGANLGKHLSHLTANEAGSFAGSLYDMAAGMMGKKTQVPYINEMNAAWITDLQWDAAYNNAVKSGNMAEAQRLRDLHFKVKAPDSKIVDAHNNALHVYHGTSNKFTSFDESKYGTTDGGMYGTGVYTTPYKDYAKYYGNNVLDLYANIKNPVDARNRSVEDLMIGKLEEGKNIFRWTDIGGRRDGVLGRNHYMNTDYPFEIVAHDPKQVKLADAVTRDDAGEIIPLSQRDNFNVSDFRYGRIGEQPKGTLVEDFTDFDTMVKRMNAPVKYTGENPFPDGKMTGFRKWALDNGAKAEKILEVERKYSQNNWEALKAYEKENVPSGFNVYDGKIYINSKEPNFNQVYPHEVEHKLFRELFGGRRKSISPEDANSAFDKSLWSIQDEQGNYYYIEDNFEEIVNRFTQIKNALGIKEYRALTEEELKRAHQMFKTGDLKIAGSDLGLFFEKMKSYKAAAKLSGKALSLAGAGTVTLKSLEE